MMHRTSAYSTTELQMTNHPLEIVGHLSLTDIEILIHSINLATFFLQLYSSWVRLPTNHFS